MELKQKILNEEIPNEEILKELEQKCEVDRKRAALARTKGRTWENRSWKRPED